MKTIISKIKQDETDDQVIKQAGDILMSGGLVAFPTETVYGLGANALDGDAAKKIYTAKERPTDNPLIIHIANRTSLSEIAVNIPRQAYELADHFWPGPLTIILEKSNIVPYETAGGLETIAVRMPDDEVARKIIGASGGFVAAPSANLSGRPSPTTADHVMEDLDGKIDMIVDGGSVPIGVESTIVDMTVFPPAILRPGAITAQMIEQVIGKIVDVASNDLHTTGNTIDGSEVVAKDSYRPKAPGMKYRHYAPQASMVIVAGEVGQTVKAIKQIAYKQTKLGYKVGIMATSETCGQYTVGLVKNIGTRENGNSIAKNLYRLLREFDQEEVDYIYSEMFELEGIRQAIMNRLLKAAGHHILQAEEITRFQKYRRILFVSGSDNCRGPMAATILENEPLQQEYQIESKGLVVLFPEPANQKAEAIMKSQQMTLSDHEAEALSDSDLDEDTLVLTMEENQKWKIVAEYDYVKNVYTLAEYVDEERSVLSLHGQPLAKYGEMYELLRELIEKLAIKLNEEEKGL